MIGSNVVYKLGEHIWGCLWHGEIKLGAWIGWSDSDQSMPSFVWAPPYGLVGCCLNEQTLIHPSQALEVLLQSLDVMTKAFLDVMEMNHVSKSIMILKKNPTKIMNLLNSLAE